jgi:DnaJ-class molecular chaperone
MRSAFLADERATAMIAAIQISWREAHEGATVPLEVPVRCTCHECGGRGESWAQPCARCAGHGTELLHHQVHVTVPAGVEDGACFHFSVAPRHDLSTRIELRVLVNPPTSG